MTPKEIALTAAAALDSKKGGDIKVLEITDLTTLVDYFVIATGTSNTQISALCGAVEEKLTAQGDYGSVAIHVFSEEAREFYSLERLWSDGKEVDLTGVLTKE